MIQIRHDKGQEQVQERETLKLNPRRITMFLVLKVAGFIKFKGSPCFMYDLLHKPVLWSACLLVCFFSFSLSKILYFWLCVSLRICITLQLVCYSPSLSIYLSLSFFPLHLLPPYPRFYLFIHPSIHLLIHREWRMISSIYFTFHFLIQVAFKSLLCPCSLSFFQSDILLSRSWSCFLLHILLAFVYIIFFSFSNRSYVFSRYKL